MRKAVNSYMQSYRNLLSAFGCKSRYYIRPALECAWGVSEAEIPILTVEADGTEQKCVIVRQDGEPLVYRANGYALVIAIDCVKTAFLLDIKKEMKI